MRIISYILTLALGVASGMMMLELSPNEVESELPTAVVVSLKEQKAPPLEEDIICLARNMYFEARNESVAGQVAVANVTLNRVKSNKFPNTVCAVVHQAIYSEWWKSTHGRDVPVRNKCQFSWYCDGKSDKIYDHKVYEDIYKLAQLVYTMNIDITDGATHYHAKYVEPSWAKTMPMVAVVDTHIFYKMN